MSEVVGPALPGEPCRVPPHESWSDLERWVWQEIGSGRIADINRRLGKTADPMKAEDWGPERRLSPNFLETILLHDPWRSATPRQGIRILGAMFIDTVDLRSASLQSWLGFYWCRFASDCSAFSLRGSHGVSFDNSVVIGTLNCDSAKIEGSFHGRGAHFSEVDLRGADIGGQLDFSGGKISGTLCMNSIRIEGSAFIHDDAEVSDVDLRGARISNQLDFGKSQVSGCLNISSARILGSIGMERGRFAHISLRSSKVDGQINLTGAKITGCLNMNELTVGESLLMRADARFSEISLRDAAVAGQLDLNCATVTSLLDMSGATIGSLVCRCAELHDIDMMGAKIEGQAELLSCKVGGALTVQSAHIGGHLIMRGGQFGTEIDLKFARVVGILDLRDAASPGLDLTGSRIDQELHLASQSLRPKWSEGAKLTLLTASADVVQDEPDAWPAKVQLDGFVYTRFGGYAAVPETAIAKRGVKWFVDWLGRDEPYTPQPYQQCAKMLREMGHPEMADDVLYAGRERERKEAWQSANGVRDYARSAGLWLLKSTVGYGYGYRYFRALEWILFFVLVGTAALLLSGTDEHIAGTIVWSAKGVFSHVLTLAFYSFDLLLPIIQLYEPHYQIVLDGAARYYFAIHKLMGYVLVSFLIAGLAGLTK